MKFTDYATQSGCLLLQEDITYLRKYVLRVPFKYRKDMLRRYVDVWVSTMRECENVVQAQNLGRRASNLWIMGFISGYNGENA